jgi:hypothetical protein
MVQGKPFPAHTEIEEELTELLDDLADASEEMRFRLYDLGLLFDRIFYGE